LDHSELAKESYFFSRNFLRPADCRDDREYRFLIREIRRNEQHDSFINAVTHELKTPIASIRLYLQTLQHRDVDEASAASSIV